MDKSIWTDKAITEAILSNSNHLEIVFTNYLRSFTERLGEYEITIQGLSSVESLYKQVLDGIAKLEPMLQEFLSVIEVLATSNHPLLEKHLPSFFERLLNYYEEKGITLYTASNLDLLKNDHYRFFNQHLFISLAALLLDNRCFRALKSILCTKYQVFYKSYGITRAVNYMRFREYNYTLNEFLNTNYPKRLSVTADYMSKYSVGMHFGKLVLADILLYYISLWNPSDEMLDPYWYPELSVYNREQFILPNLVSKKYFEEVKILFKVDTIEDFKQLIDATDDRLQRGGLYRVPSLKDGLMYDMVGSLD